MFERAKKIMGNLITLEVKTRFGVNIDCIVQDACKLAKTLELAKVVFDGNGLTYECYPDDTAIVYSKDKIVKRWGGIVKLDWSYLSSETSGKGKEL